MSWSLHIHLLDWLLHERKWKSSVTSAHIKELLAASAMRWISNNMENIGDIDTRSIVIYSPHLPGYAVGGIKSSSATESPKLKLLKVSKDDQPDNNVFVLVKDIDSWTHGGWSPIPL
ncbi:MAG: hypothetical protein KZQ97_11130 [Candidatus Thiodiazotropha sp. (ex Dulcina madagascariensis)]|nr:hypothetical protein [Candidatus Thiodiazotropha sp. (ex Dulcina madagascariensis)]